jgi:hypothetical protein
VWFLAHWPLVVESTGKRVAFATRLCRSARRALRLLLEFRASTFVGEVIDVKREALARHRSQHDTVLHGEFLELFLDDYERFKIAGFPGGDDAQGRVKA